MSQEGKLWSEFSNKQSRRHHKNFTWFSVVRAPRNVLGAISAIKIGTYHQHYHTKKCYSVYMDCGVNKLTLMGSPRRRMLPFHNPLPVFQDPEPLLPLIMTPFNRKKERERYIYTLCKVLRPAQAFRFRVLSKTLAKKIPSQPTTQKAEETLIAWIQQIHK